MELLPTLLFVLLTIFVMIPTFPLSWSLIAFMTLFHLDLSGFTFASATSLGIENAIKSVVLPFFLLIRTNFIGTKRAIKTPAFCLWIIFIIYTGIASVWSPFVLSALKQVAYFVTYTMIFSIFINIYHSRGSQYLSLIILKSFVLTILLAIIQTLFAGNPFGTVENRFTSFTPPQSFALYLTFMTSTILLLPNMSRKFSIARVSILFVIILAVFLSGSRTGLLATTMIVMIGLFMWSLAKGHSLRLLSFLFSLNLAFLLIVLIIATPTLPAKILGALTQQRSLQTFILLQDKSLNDISTFRFRTEVINASAQLLKQKKPIVLLLGNGTSSIAELVTRGYVYYRGYTASNIDANRVAHNEFIRTFYEWGGIGSLLVFLMLIILFVHSVWIAVKLKNAKGFVILASFLYIIIVLSTSNLFAAASSPAGLGLILYLVQLTGIYQPGSVLSKQP